MTVTTTTATLDLRALEQALMENNAEKRGIEIGMCLAAAIMERDFDNGTYALEILGVAGIDADIIGDLDLDEYDSAPLLRLLAADTMTQGAAA